MCGNVTVKKEKRLTNKSRLIRNKVMSLLGIINGKYEVKEAEIWFSIFEHKGHQKVILNCMSIK